MPNGESKNWIRFLDTLEKFYVLYGKWPSTIHVYPLFISELQEALSQKDFQKLQSKIQLIPDKDNPFLASDDVSNRFDYGRGPHPHGCSSARAIDWIKINKPDYYD